MAACGNEEGLIGLDCCGGPKEGDQGAVMRMDLLVQTRGASKSVQNTADRQVTPCYRGSLCMWKDPVPQGHLVTGQGNEVLPKATTLPSRKNSHQNHGTDSVEFRYSLRSQSNRKAAGRELPVPAITKEQTEKCKPTGICCLQPCQSQMWQLGPLETVKGGKPRHSKCQDCQQHN